MKTLAKNKTTLVAIALFMMIIYVYNLFKSDTQLIAPVNVGEDIVELFARLEQVTLNQELFSSPLYRNLNDHSVELVPEPTGRTNPFNPIGRD